MVTAAVEKSLNFSASDENRRSTRPPRSSAAYSTGVQAYLYAANAALSNPNAFQTYGSNSEPSSPLTINMDQSVYSPGDLALERVGEFFGCEDYQFWCQLAEAFGLGGTGVAEL